VVAYVGHGVAGEVGGHNLYSKADTATAKSYPMADIENVLRSHTDTSPIAVGCHLGTGEAMGAAGSEKSLISENWFTSLPKIAQAIGRQLCDSYQSSTRVAIESQLRGQSTK
jgi:hypothetical protein